MRSMQKRLSGLEVRSGMGLDPVLIFVAFAKDPVEKRDGEVVTVCERAIIAGADVPELIRAEDEGEADFRDRANAAFTALQKGGAPR